MKILEAIVVFKSAGYGVVARGMDGRLYNYGAAIRDLESAQGLALRVSNQGVIEAKDWQVEP